MPWKSMLLLGDLKRFSTSSTEGTGLLQTVALNKLSR